MQQSASRQRRQKIFTWIIVGCIALSVGYTYWVIQRSNVSATVIQAESPGEPLPVAGPDELARVQEELHLLFINQDVQYTSKVKIMELGSLSPKQEQTMLVCDRVHYAADTGICLSYDEEQPDVLAWVTLFGPDFQPRYKFIFGGVISRARISPDGKYAAATVFVSGHSYQDANMSTATILIDTATGETLGNLEEFETWKDGRRFQAPEFNFWGVTFAPDSNRFYATLRNGDKTYLVEGDIAARKLTVLHENVECPSLSPDGTRIAFKKLTPRGMWQLTVLDLATMKETSLAEKEHVDDQVEWLDNQHILYQKLEFEPPDPKWVSIFVVPADGSGTPEILIPNATSPTVVR